MKELLMNKLLLLKKPREIADEFPLFLILGLAIVLHRHSGSALQGAFPVSLHLNLDHRMRIDQNRTNYAANV
jgi:hypothetical protein